MAKPTPPTCTHCGNSIAGRWIEIYGDPYCDNGRCGRNMSRKKRGAPPLPPFGEK